MSNERTTVAGSIGEGTAFNACLHFMRVNGTFVFIDEPELGGPVLPEQPGPPCEGCGKDIVARGIGCGVPGDMTVICENCDRQYLVEKIKTL